MDNLIQFEDLPNELIIDIFKYLDARTIYYSFFNLNYRFNILLKSLTRLCLVLSTLKNDFYDDLFASRVYTLIVHCDIIFTLSRYINVRRLILFNSKYDQISEIMIKGSHLETISLISPRCFYTTYTFHEMIFSNKFPYLKSCYLTTVYLPSYEIRQLSWKQLPSLRVLHISSYDSLIHIPILNACPNLYFLHLSLFQLDYTSLNNQQHKNLKKLKIVFNNHIWPIDNKIFETFFFLIPYLEYLYIQPSIYLSDKCDVLIQFNWIENIIKISLPYLKQFIFYIHLLNSHQIDQYKLNQYICQIKKNFQNIFQNYKNYYLYIKN